jgi:hypothetical protein
MDALTPMSARRSSRGAWRSHGVAAAFALMVALVVLPTTRLWAQDEAAPGAPPAHRVRLVATTPSGDPAQYEGMASLRADTLVLVDDSGRRTIPVATIRYLELSRGRQGNGTMGTLLGLGVGVAMGMDASPAGGGDGSMSGEVLLLPISMLAWSWLGYYFGGKIRTERWQEIPVERLLEP